jgi:regulator of protease activity HflC (stomatin/prohibitin superfamily)
MKEGKQTDQISNSGIPEKELKPISGFTVLMMNLAMGMFGMYLMWLGEAFASPLGFLVVLIALGMAVGYFSVAPGEAKLVMLLGQYRGTIKKNGFYWLTPFTRKLPLSVSAQDFVSQPIKATDGSDQPFEIQLSVNWQLKDTTVAFFQSDLGNLAESVTMNALKESAHKTSFDLANTVQSKSNFQTLLQHGITERLTEVGITAHSVKVLSLLLPQKSENAPADEVESLMATRAKILSKAISLADQAVKRMEEKEVLKLNEATRAKLIADLVVVLAKDPSA